MGGEDDEGDVCSGCSGATAAVGESMTTGWGTSIEDEDGPGGGELWAGEGAKVSVDGGGGGGGGM